MMKDNREIYGITTIGEKGQVVIPANARKMLKLEKGQKLLVLGMGHEMITFAKLSNIEQFVSHVSKKLKIIRKMARSNKKK